MSMTFDFNFDLTKIDGASQQNALSSQEQAILDVIKRLLQHPDNDALFEVEKLSQQLEQEFLPWLAMFGEQSAIQEDYQQLQHAMQSYQWNICYPNFVQCQQLPIGILPQDTLEQLFESIQIQTYLTEWQTLLQLCKQIPCVIGFQQQFSLAAINSFHTRIALRSEDLNHLEQMIIGQNNTKVDLASLITLEIGLPTWIWKNMVLLQQVKDSSDLTYSQLKKQLKLTDTQAAPQQPIQALKQLFQRTQSHAQQNLEQMKQQLSLLTQTLLDEDRFDSNELKMITELQANTRKETSLLQQQIKKYEQFVQSIENTLATLSI